MTDMLDYLASASGHWLFLLAAMTIAYIGVDYKTTTSHVSRPPGHFWVRVLSFVYAKKTYERVYAPHIADMRAQYYEALLAGEKWKARWIVVRDNAIIVPMIAVHLPHWLLKLVIKAWTLIP